VVPGVSGDERLRGGDHRREPALHVRRAPPVEHAVADGGGERVVGPFLERTGRHHIGVAGEAEHRAVRASVPRPEIRDAAEAHLLDLKSEGREARSHHVLAALVGGCDRAAGDQIEREVEGVRHVSGIGAWT
jgi:hypothetical protein